MIFTSIVSSKFIFPVSRLIHYIYHYGHFYKVPLEIAFLRLN